VCFVYERKEKKQGKMGRGKTLYIYKKKELKGNFIFKYGLFLQYCRHRYSQILFNYSLCSGVDVLLVLKDGFVTEKRSKQKYMEL
jgi:hypothetical protein